MYVPMKMIHAWPFMPIFNIHVYGCSVWLICLVMNRKFIIFNKYLTSMSRYHMLSIQTSNQGCQVSEIANYGYTSFRKGKTDKLLIVNHVHGKLH